MTLIERIVELHRSLDATDIPYAFGGALALAWCTEQARGTNDIDINLFLNHEQADEALAALPANVRVADASREAITADGQARLWWDDTPVDVFFNTTDFHRQAAARVRRRQFAGHDMPFLACDDLAVFKAFFNRTQDWADIERMAEAGTLDLDFVIATIAQYLGPDDPRIERLRSIAAR